MNVEIQDTPSKIIPVEQQELIKSNLRMVAKNNNMKLRQKLYMQFGVLCVLPQEETPAHWMLCALSGRCFFDEK